MDALLEETLRDAGGILFLCTGNMVRSAFAHLYAEHLGCPLPVRSAATVYRNDGLYRETALALRARGVPDGVLRAFRPTHVDDILASLPADVVSFGMRHEHVAALAGRPEIARRAFLLGEVVGEGEIADPVLEGADFAATFSTVARGVDALLRRLQDG